eukprot:1160524-Pelagomonas_calceolata.AAC.8
MEKVLPGEVFWSNPMEGAIWEHVAYEPTMNNGREGFDYSTAVNLDHTNALDLIRAVLSKNNNNNLQFQIHFP